MARIRQGTKVLIQSDVAESRASRNLALLLAILVIWTIITVFGARLIYSGDVSLGDVVKTGIAWQILAAALFLVCVIRFFNWRDLGLRGPQAGTLRLLWLPFLILALMGILAVLSGLPPVPVVVMILLNTLLVGFSEEVMFRGIFYSALRDRVSIWPSILWTSVAFGAVHVLNGFVTGDFGTATIQAFAAAASGLVFIAIRLRTGSLWVAIAYHALWDWILFIGIAGAEGAVPEQVNATPSIATMLLPFTLVLPNALYALWLLRGVGRSLPLGDPKAI